MKLTKQKLRKIIKEEKMKMNEEKNISKLSNLLTNATAYDITVGMLQKLEDNLEDLDDTQFNKFKNSIQSISKKYIKAKKEYDLIRHQADALVNQLSKI